MVIETLTGLLVVITGFYAWVSFRMMKATERHIAALLRPYISVRALLLPDRRALVLKITNEGKIGAENLKLTMDRDFYAFGHKTNDENVAKAKAFTDVISSFSPGAELSFELASAYEKFDRNSDVKPAIFKVRVEFEYGGAAVDEVTTIDLSMFEGSTMEPDPSAELKRIADGMKSLDMNLMRVFGTMWSEKSRKASQS
jgi:hypothetical protein